MFGQVAFILTICVHFGRIFSQSSSSRVDGNPNNNLVNHSTGDPYLSHPQIILPQQNESHLDKRANNPDDPCKVGSLNSCSAPGQIKKKRMGCQLPLPDCSGYIDCSIQGDKMIACPDGYLFDVTTESCKSSKLFTCPNSSSPDSSQAGNECSGLLDTCMNYIHLNSSVKLTCLFADADCKGYYNCSDYKHYSCIPLMFDNVTKMCTNQTRLCKSLDPFPVTTATTSYTTVNPMRPSAPTSTFNLITPNYDGYSNIPDKSKNNLYSTTVSNLYSLQTSSSDQPTSTTFINPVSTTMRANRQAVVFIKYTKTEFVGNTRAEFQCIIVNYKTDRFSWYLDNKQIKPSKRVTILNNGLNQSNLIIDPIMDSENGNLTCYGVYNSVFHDFDTITISIIGLLQLKIAPLFQKIYFNIYVTVTCNVTGLNEKNNKTLNEAQIVWYVNGSYLQSEPAQIQNQKIFYINQTCNIACGLDSTSMNVDRSELSQFEYVQIQSMTKVCTMDEVWGPMNPSSVEFIQCPANYNGYMTRTCYANSTWGQVDMSGCLMTVMNDLNIKVKNLEMQITSINSTEITNLTSSLPGVFINCRTKADFKTGVDILYRIATIRNDSSSDCSDVEVKEILESLGIMLDSGGWAEKGFQSLVDSLKLVQTINMYSNNSWNKQQVKPTFLQPNDYITFESRHLDAKDLTFPNWKMFNFSMSSPGNIITILSTNETSGKHASCSFVKNLADTLPVPENNSFINSGLLSMDIMWMDDDVSYSHKPIFVEITLEHLQQPSSYDLYNSSCVFWRFTDRLDGEWSSDGCTVKTMNSTHTTCTCNHLTNFAILFSPYRATGVQDRILSLISLVGCIISIVSLSFTIIYYAVKWRKLKSTRTVMLMNLCVALIIANIIFLAGVNQTTDKNGCTAVAILLHYFFLASFFIMLIIAIHLLISVFSVFTFQAAEVAPCKLIIMLVLAWVVPLIIVFISMGSTKLVGYGNEYNCWLSYENGVLWAFVGPALVIIIFNILVAVAVLIRICNVNIPVVQSNKKSKLLSTARNILILNPILGITWIFGVLSVNEELIAFQYIFAIVNSLQGFFIFMLHAVCHIKNNSSKSTTSSSSNHRMKEKLPPSQQPRIHLARQSQEWMGARGSIHDKLTKHEQEMCAEDYLEYRFSLTNRNPSPPPTTNNNNFNFTTQVSTDGTELSNASSTSSRTSSPQPNTNMNVYEEQVMEKF